MWVSACVAHGGARKWKTFPGAGSPRAEMQHSRLSTQRSAWWTTSTSSAANSDSGGSVSSRRATPRPSMVSPARASFNVRLPCYNSRVIVTYAVLYHPEAEAERDRLPRNERLAIATAVEKLAARRAERRLKELDT